MSTSSSGMNYKTLKRYIVRSAEKVGKRGVDFKINIERLNRDVAELQLTCIPYGEHARQISPNDLPMLVEYYREDKLEWLSREKYITSLIFVDSTKMDEHLNHLIHRLMHRPEDDPDMDPVRILGEILGSYPCYLAVVVSYQNNSPNSVGRNSYFIACRANKVIIKDPAYVYVPHHPATDPQPEPEDPDDTEIPDDNIPDDSDTDIDESEV